MDPFLVPKDALPVGWPSSQGKLRKTVVVEVIQSLGAYPRALYKEPPRYKSHKQIDEHLKQLAQKGFKVGRPGIGEIQYHLETGYRYRGKSEKKDRQRIVHPGTKIRLTGLEVQVDKGITKGTQYEVAFGRILGPNDDREDREYLFWLYHAGVKKAKTLEVEDNAPGSSGDQSAPSLPRPGIPPTEAADSSDFRVESGTVYHRDLVVSGSSVADESAVDNVRHNRNRIENIRAALSDGKGNSNDAETLAEMFSDVRVRDDGTVVGRLEAILNATRDPVLPLWQGGLEFGDGGFAKRFQDPWERSSNQVGHFLSAVLLGFSPEEMSMRVGGGLRYLLGADSEMDDEEAAQRLVIGHEKVTDEDPVLRKKVGSVILQSLRTPPDPTTFVRILGLIWAASEPDEGESGELDESMAQAVADKILKVLKARSEFAAATSLDLQHFNAALEALEGSGYSPATGQIPPQNFSDAEEYLEKIEIPPRAYGCSLEDLRLSLMGWYFGKAAALGEFQDKEQMARWIRKNLTE